MQTFYENLISKRFSRCNNLKEITLIQERCTILPSSYSKENRSFPTIEITSIVKIINSDIFILQESKEFEAYKFEYNDNVSSCHTTIKKHINDITNKEYDEYYPLLKNAELYIVNEVDILKRIVHSANKDIEKFNNLCTLSKNVIKNIRDNIDI